jgi:hypothetical protein
VWVIGTNPVAGGYGIYRWNGTGWSREPGGAVAIAVEADGAPLVINSAHQIYECAGSGWLQRPGPARDIAAGADGSVCPAGTRFTDGPEVVGVGCRAGQSI